MSKMSLSQVLRQLMFKQNITATELARRAKLPQQTLQRIISGNTQNPHRASLQSLANYFKLSAAQLKGLEPIPYLTDTIAASSWVPIPLIAWQDIPQHTSLREHHSTVLTNANIDEHAFATLMNDASMSPLFPQGSTLIVDPDKPIKDRCYVIAQLHASQDIVFRWLLSDGQEFYIKAISPDFADCALTKMQEQDKIHGVLVQTQCYYE